MGTKSGAPLVVETTIGRDPRAMVSPAFGDRREAIARALPQMVSFVAGGQHDDRTGVEL